MLGVVVAGEGRDCDQHVGGQVPAGRVGLLVVALGLSQRLIDPNTITGDGRYALVIAEDEVLMAFPAGDLMSRSNVLKPGDQVDLLFTMDLPTSRVPVGTGPREAGVARSSSPLT